MGQYIRHASASLDEVIPQILAHWNLFNIRHTLDSGYSIGVSSLRMKTFGRDANQIDGLKCVECQLHATFFGIETFSRSTIHSMPHANLYGINSNGNDVLFTHDHILARSLGGLDDLSNSQVMCHRCNTRKSLGENKAATALKIANGTWLPNVPKLKNKKTTFWDESTC